MNMTPSNMARDTQCTRGYQRACNTKSVSRFLLSIMAVLFPVLLIACNNGDNSEANASALDNNSVSTSSASYTPAPTPTPMPPEEMGLVPELTRKELTEGQRNIVLRARQLTEIEWTPLADVASDSAPAASCVFVQGRTYTGIPYGQPVNGGLFVFNKDDTLTTTLDTFIEAVADPNSLMYTEQGCNRWYRLGDEVVASYCPYYSNDCSTFVAYCWDLPRRMATSDFAVAISTFKDVGGSINDIEVGYALLRKGAHIILITDIAYDADGNIAQVTTMEQTPPAAVKKVYGIGGSAGSIADLSERITLAGYRVIRYKDMDSVTYTPVDSLVLSDDVAVSANTETYTTTNKFNCYLDTPHIAGGEGKVMTNTFEFDADDDVYIELAGWTVCEGGVKAVEYNVNGYGWYSTPLTARSDVYEAMKTTFPDSRDFNAFDCGIDLSYLYKGMTHSLQLRGISHDGSAYVFADFDIVIAGN